MQVNQKCKVSSDHKFFPNRIGYFQFYGEGASENCVILSAEPSSEERRRNGQVLFSVRKSEITPVND